MSDNTILVIGLFVQLPFIVGSLGFLGWLASTFEVLGIIRRVALDTLREAAPGPNHLIRTRAELLI